MSIVKTDRTQRIYFVGGGLPREVPLNIPSGWQLASDPHPGPDYVLARISAFRLRKDGTSIRLYKFELRQTVLDGYAARLTRLRLQRLDDDAAEIARTDRTLLARKNAANGIKPMKRRKRRPS